MDTQSLPEKILFYRLETEEITRETWEEFIRTYCNYILIRPWLAYGSMTLCSQLELWNREARYGIVLAARDFDPWPNSVTETVLHELAHILFYVVGMKEHSEAEVERVGKILAIKYPWILDVMVKIFPGLSFSREYFRKAFNKPVQVFLPLPSPPA